MSAKDATMNAKDATRSAKDGTHVLKEKERKPRRYAPGVRLRR